MIDLTNKSIEEVNLLIQKYATVLEVSKVKTINSAQILVIVIDEAVNYINDKYKELNADLKTWCILVLKHNLDKIKTDVDVKKYIDEFIEHWKTKHQSFCDNIVISASNFDRDFLFFKLFLNKT